MTIGENIKNRRTELGLTQDELARKSGYKSRSSINKIELSRDLPLKKVEDVAKALECNPAELCGWVSDKQQKTSSKPNDNENKTDIMALGQKIKALRNSNNITQTELAEKLGYSDKSMVSRVENGLVDLPFSKIMALTKIFNCDANTLLDIEKRPLHKNDNYSNKEKSLIESYRRLTDVEKRIIDKILDN